MPGRFRLPFLYVAVLPAAFCRKRSTVDLALTQVVLDSAYLPGNPVPETKEQWMGAHTESFRTDQRVN